MGIKFRCPNGHKLNVKSFLAGKKGICPHCGTKVMIPADAERDEADDEFISDAASGGVAIAKAGTAIADTIALQTMSQPLAMQPAQPVQPVAAVTPVAVAATPVAVAAVPQAAVPQTVPVSPVPVSPLAATVAPVTAIPTSVVPIGTVGLATTITQPVPSMPMPGMPMPMLAADPIAEAPNAVWYVRPPSGGQFGPARGDIMRKWLTEGRVSADSLVWRDGWGDWKSAALTFPQLGPVPGAAPLAAAGPAVNLGSPAAVATTAGRAVGRSRKKSSGFALAMVVTLGLLSVVLTGFLIFVISGGFGE